MNKKASRFASKPLIYLLLFILALLIIVPIAWVLMSSLKPNDEFSGSAWRLPSKLMFSNFSDAWSKANMGEFFFNSVFVTAIAIALLLVVALPAAYVLARYKFFGRRFFNTLFMGGLFVNVSYIAVPIYLMVLDVDKWLKDLFGYTGNAFWIYDNHITLAIIYASTALPFTVYLLSSYFATLPKDFEEAAYVDGAGYTRTMVKIIFPLAKPSIVTVILFNFLSFWNEYIVAKLMIISKGKQTLSVGLSLLMRTDRSASQFGRMYAGLVIVMLPTLLIYILVQNKLTKGMTVGGIKG